MKKIGREVLFLKAKENNPRNGEGSMIQTRDGDILFAFTEYIGNNAADHAEARISVCRSTDNGESWSEAEVMIPLPTDAQNIMSPSLFRLKDGGIGIVYLRKDLLESGGVICMPVFSRSDDEGLTWSEPRSCGFPDGYYCAINDGVVVTKSGRIYIAASYTGKERDVMKLMKQKPAIHVSDVRISYSDDNGQSWSVLKEIISLPFESRYGLYEPGMYEHNDGTLWLYARTVYGHQYQSFSADEGLTWSAAEPNCRFTSPDSPMRVKRLGEYTCAIFNPLGYNCLFTETESNKSPKRTPIVMAVSRKDGKDLCDPSIYAYHGGFLDIAKNTYLLEDDLSESYCYPSALALDDGILVSYYHSNGSGKCLNSCKVIKIKYDEIK